MDEIVEECKDCGAHVMVNDLRKMEAQIAEIHALMKGFANALNSPMLKAMLPPQMRGMLGG